MCILQKKSEKPRFTLYRLIISRGRSARFDSLKYDRNYGVLCRNLSIVCRQGRGYVCNNFILFDVYLKNMDTSYSFVTIVDQRFVINVICVRGYQNIVIGKSRNNCCVIKIAGFVPQLYKITEFELIDRNLCALWADAIVID